jgi:hypothetical protein
MSNFIIRYKVTETTLGGIARKKYITSLLVQADTEVLAQQIVTDSYVDTQDISYDINFL